MVGSLEHTQRMTGLQSVFLHIITVGTIWSKMQMACCSDAQCGAWGHCTSSCEQDAPWTLHRVTGPNTGLPRGLHPQGTGAALGPRGCRASNQGSGEMSGEPGGRGLEASVPAWVPFCVDRGYGPTRTTSPHRGFLPYLIQGMAARASQEQPLGSLSFSPVVTICQLGPEGQCLWASPLCSHRPRGQGYWHCRLQRAVWFSGPSPIWQIPWPLVPEPDQPSSWWSVWSPESEKLSADLFL